MNLTFVLLGLAIAAAWIAPLRVRGVAVPPWTALFGLAVLAGAVEGVVAPAGLVALGLLCSLAAAARFASRGRGVLALVAAAWALALSLHVVPGFRNPVFYDAVRFSSDSLPFTARLNFDKAAAGLILLVAFCRPGQGADARRTLAWTLGAALVTPVVAIGVATCLGFTRFEPMAPDGRSAAFLAANLLFTCVAEEAFFRGLIQERIARLAERAGRAAWRWVAIVVASALFGLAHAGGGPVLMLVAAIAGLGYGIAYAKTQRIESAILVHFALNAAHFTCFAYPALAH